MWWLNETNNTEQPEIDEDLADAQLAQKIIFVFLTILTIFGNTLVLVATWKERSLHQPNKYFVACLAVADLLVGMILEPLRLYQNTGVTDAQSSHSCRFAVWIDTSALAASIYTLTFISFDRYLKVKKPLQYRSRMTTSKSLKIIFIIWLISTAFASYAANPHSGSFGILLTGGGFCDDVKYKNRKRFYTFAAISLFFLPTVVILVMYALIFVVVHKRQKMLRNGELGQICNDTNQRSAFLQDLKTIRMLLVVVGVFILCWGPVFIYIMFIFYKPNLTDWDSTRPGFIVSKVIFRLPYFNSMCNPIIYACLDQTYREAFKNIFQRMLCRSRPRRRQLPETIELPPLRTR